MFYTHIMRRSLKFFLIVVIFTACYWISVLIIEPVQHELLGQTSEVKSRINLTHGVCVLATMLYGWRVILDLAVGKIGVLYLCKPEQLAKLEEPLWLLPVFLSAACAFIAFELFRCFGKDYYAKSSGVANWKPVFIVGSVAALINAMGQLVLANTLFFWDASVDRYAMFVLGNIGGMLSLFIILMFLFRWVRLRKGRY